MTRRWYHDVSAAWLEARKSVLTATEIKALLPEYRRMQKKPMNPDELSPGFSSFWAEKNTITELDTSAPSSAAARGHVMEPYAIASWSNQKGKPMYHWDDCVITRGLVGFSPDALDIPQLSNDPKLTLSDDRKFLIGDKGFSCDVPTMAIEVKSYEPKAHWKACIASKMDHDELIQLATAFYVLPELQEARLLFFCPGAPISMKEFVYKRKELSDLIQMVEDVACEYARNAAICKLWCESPGLQAGYSEDQIWEEYNLEHEVENYDSVFVLKRW